LKGGQSLVKLYLDGGHGGSDSGAVGNGIFEKDINLKIVKKIETLLKENYKNVDTLMTRDSDVYYSLAERTNKANAWGADAFLSVHINAHTDKAVRGFETYIYPNAGAKTAAFQNVMHENIFGQISHSGIRDIGKKSANFHVLRESNMIAILTENLFISNATDASLLKQDVFLDKLAYGHVLGLERFFGLEKEIRPPTSGVLYQVIAGTFSTKENADDMAKKLTADGYDCYVARKE
jgi:N-acetylmuramoyl-L-alanine amidase